jgi:preprotein translocase subunit YajC
MYGVFLASLILFVFGMSIFFFILWNDRKERRTRQTKQ